MSDNNNSNVQVVVRLRPPDDPRENIEDVFSIPTDKPHVITIKDPLSRGRSDHTFLFSKVLLPDTTQQTTFEIVCKPLVQHVVSGFNATAFAYGQTSSGKSYTIFGEGGQDKRGLLPRAVEYLFEKIEEQSERKEIGMVCSFLEIYLDQVRDLGQAFMADRQNQLNNKRNEENQRSMATTPASGAVRTGPGKPGGNRPYSALGTKTQMSSGGGANSTPGQRPNSAMGGGKAQFLNCYRTNYSAMGGGNIGSDGAPQVDLSRWGESNLEIHEAPDGHVYVKDLTLIPIRNMQEIIDVINLGVSLRETHSTAMNFQSSRSHTVFTINVVQKDRNSDDSEVVSGMLNLVDLAGSERLSKSKSEGTRFAEAVTINSSLSALGRVVLALAQNPRDVKYVPYRDAKLTRVLQHSLGGNSFTSLLCCIHPGFSNYEESLNSLCFADRCRNMENRPTINYLDPSKQGGDRRVRRLLAEIADLKSQLDISKATFEQRVNFMNETLGAGGMPEFMKDLDDDAKAEKAFQDRLNELEKEGQQKLLEEKQKTAAALKRAEEATKFFESSQKERAVQDEKRRSELTALRDRMLSQEKELLQQKLNNEQQIEELKMRHQGDLEHWRSEIQKLLAGKNDLLMRVPDLIKDSSLLLATKKVEWKEKVDALNDRQKHHLHVLKDSHEKEKEALINQHRFYLAEKEQANEEVLSDFKQYHEKKKKEAQQYEEELLALYELVQQLTRIIHDMESGSYPVCYKSGVKCVQLPPGIKPRLPNSSNRGGFEKLFSAMAETRRKATKYEKMMQLRSLNNSDNNNNSGGAVSGPGAALSSNGLDSNKMSSNAAALSNWNPVDFSKDFCRTSEADALDCLRVLNNEQLKALCVSLKDRCNGEFDIQAEKNHVRDEVLRDLSSHSTIEYLRFLETEVSRYKAMLGEETEKTRNLKIALGGNNSGLKGGGKIERSN